MSATRAPELARAVRAALADTSRKLTKGPFLESLPDYGKQGSIRELVNTGVLAREWRILSGYGVRTASRSSRFTLTKSVQFDTP